MRIYVASSWRNPLQPAVVALLREHVAECYIQELIDPLVALVDAHAAPATMGDEAPASFVAYVAKNYPPMTVMSDPEWHAPRLWRAAVHAMRHPDAPAPERAP